QVTLSECLLVSVVLCGDSATRPMQFAPEEADDNGGDIEGSTSAQHLQHGLSGGASGLTVVTGALDGLRTVLVDKVGAAVVPGIRVAVPDLIDEGPRLRLRGGLPHQTDEGGALDLELRLPLARRGSAVGREAGELFCALRLGGLLLLAHWVLFSCSWCCGAWDLYAVRRRCPPRCWPSGPPGVLVTWSPASLLRAGTAPAARHRWGR